MKRDAKADDQYEIAELTSLVSGARATKKTELMINCAKLAKQANLLASKDQSCLRQNWGSLTSTIPEFWAHLRNWGLNPCFSSVIVN